METFSDEEHALARRFAGAIVERRMATPALLFFEGMRPLNFMGSQALHFFNPVLSVVFSFRQIEMFARFLEKRDAVDLVLREIEGQEDDRARKHREERKRLKEERRRRRAESGRPRWWPF